MGRDARAFPGRLREWSWWVLSQQDWVIPACRQVASTVHYKVSGKVLSICYELYWRVLVDSLEPGPSRV